jgi:hypothetical protein
MKINYGINRQRSESRKRWTEHKNGKLVLNGRWANSTFHELIRSEIMKLHPGWTITGYAKVG